MINVQFSDDKETTIVSIFTGKQDDSIFPNQGEVEPSDVRYKSFYNSLPDYMKNLMPTPE